MGEVQYQIAMVGEPFRPRIDSKRTAIERFHDRIAHNQHPPVRIKVGDEIGQKRPIPEAMDRVSALLDSLPVGQRITVLGDRDSDHKWCIHATQQYFGEAIIDIAADQLGVDYVWADADPVGGGSSGFDCSGLVLYCYNRGAGITLPHSADAIMDASKACGRDKVKRGDLVFYNYGRLAPGHADHIAICTSKDTQIAASSGADAVVRQSIDDNDVIRYGYFTEATGKH